MFFDKVYQSFNEDLSVFSCHVAGRSQYWMDIPSVAYLLEVSEKDVRDVADNLQTVSFKEGDKPDFKQLLQHIVSVEPEEGGKFFLIPARAIMSISCILRPDIFTAICVSGINNMLDEVIEKSSFVSESETAH